MLVKNFVKESELHGLGVYAGEFIPKGTLIWTFNPVIDRVIGDKELESLPIYSKNYVLFYSYKVEEDVYVLCGDNGRYFNHSDTPNTAGVESADGYGATVARRDIQEGEELTCDYNETDGDFERKKSLNQFK